MAYFNLPFLPAVDINSLIAPVNQEHFCFCSNICWYVGSGWVRVTFLSFGPKSESGLQRAWGYMNSRSEKGTSHSQRATPWSSPWTEVCVCVLLKGREDMAMRTKSPICDCFCLLFAVFGGSSWEQSGGCGCKFDSDGPGPASLSQLECHLPHHQRGSLWPLHHPDRPCHQWGHGNCGQGKWEAKVKPYFSPFKLTKAERIAQRLQLFHALSTWEYECFNLLFPPLLCGRPEYFYYANDSEFLPL